MFAGQDFRELDEVTPGDVVVPIVDLGFHNGYMDHDPNTLWDEYQWHGNVYVCCVASMLCRPWKMFLCTLTAIHVVRIFSLAQV